jgi:polysaccharide biosynthesis/export protein
MCFKLLHWFVAGWVFSGVMNVAIAQQIGRAEQERPLREGVPAAAYTRSMEVLDDKRPLRIGDRLSMRVVEDRQPPVELFVTDSGEVEVPLIGRVHAAGMTCKQLAYQIKGPLERDYFYKGPLDIPPDETFTVSKAIMRAGGFADFANKRKIKLIRKKGDSTETIIVNVDQVVNRGRIDKDPVVEAGDTIIVPERLINF